MYVKIFKNKTNGHKFLFQYGILLYSPLKKKKKPRNEKQKHLLPLMKLRNDGIPELQYIKRTGTQYRLSNMEESQTKVPTTRDPNKKQADKPQ